MGNKLKFSSELAEKNFEKMKLSTKWLAVEMHLWAKDQGIDLVFTATWSSPEEDKKLLRVSDTHRTGRAFDIRTKDLPKEFKSRFLEHFRTLYNNSMGAVTPRGSDLIVDKPHGSGPHWHVQIRRDYDETKTETHSS